MRVLVTRAADDAGRTTAALERLGHTAVIAPVLVIAPRAVIVPARHPTGLVVTSHHAFAAETPAALNRTLPVFAVGSRTAAAARAFGFKDVRVGTDGGEGLASLVVLTLHRPAFLLYLAGRDRKPGLEAALTAAGFEVEIVETYAAGPADAWPEAAVDALRGGGVEAAFHYSRRSAELALELARHHDLLDRFLDLRHLCLSTDAAEPLMAAKALSVGVADRPDEGSLLALLQNLRI